MLKNCDAASCEVPGSCNRLVCFRVYAARGWPGSTPWCMAEPIWRSSPRESRCCYTRRTWIVPPLCGQRRSSVRPRGR